MRVHRDRIQPVQSTNIRQPISHVPGIRQHRRRQCHRVVPNIRPNRVALMDAVVDIGIGMALAPAPGVHQARMWFGRPDAPAGTRATARWIIRRGSTSAAAAAAIGPWPGVTGSGRRADRGLGVEVLLALFRRHITVESLNGRNVVLGEVERGLVAAVEGGHQRAVHLVTYFMSKYAWVINGVIECRTVNFSVLWRVDIVHHDHTLTSECSSPSAWPISCALVCSKLTPATTTKKWGRDWNLVFAEYRVSRDHDPSSQFSNNSL